MNALDHIEFADSYLLGIYAQGPQLRLRVLFAIGPGLSAYSAPLPGEQHCYREGEIRIDGIVPISQKNDLRPALNIDPDGTLDLGFIELTEQEGGYLLYTQWGELRFRAEKVAVVFDQPEKIASLVQHEIARVGDVEALRIIAAGLVEPRPVMLDWDYGPPGQQFEGWVVFDHAAQSDTWIVYCEQGFGPSCPWGLVAARPVDGQRSIGMDSGWFPSFLEAFWDSHAATPLLAQGLQPRR